MSDKLSPVVRLADHHDMASFSCGKPGLDDWLKRFARQADAMDSSRTFVVHRDDIVVAYYSLTMGSVEREEPPPQLVRGLPRYPAGVVLLARLAVTSSEAGRGLGAAVLADALRRGTLAGEAVAARLFMVDAVDRDAATYYQRFGFLPAPTQPMRLYLRIKDIRVSMKAAGGL